MPNWMVRSLGGDAQGPYSTEQIIAAVDEGDLGVEIEVTPEGEDRWLPIEMVPEFADLAFFDGETNVVDAPWFADMARRGGLGPNRKVSEPQMGAVSVTQASAPETAAPAAATPQAPTPTPRLAVTQPPRPDKTLASAAQPTQAPRPGATRPLGVYGDEDVATKVVASPSELLEAAGGPPAARGDPGLADDSTIDWNPPSSEASSERFESVPPSASQPGDLYDDFDETMTRVAVRSDPAEPAVRPPAPGGGVLPTLTMNRDFLPATVNQPSHNAPGAQGGLGVDPLAATAKPYGAEPVQPYAPPAPQAAPQPAPAQSPAAGASYPQQQPNFGQPYDPGQPTYQYAEAPEETNETGVKALIFLIILLAMALTVVLVLLINQT